jgi:SAM-dependent methyltransferase
MGTMAEPAIVRAQYVDDSRLAARQALWRHRTGPSLVDTVLDWAELGGDESIADVGCGNGVFLSSLRDRGHRGPLVGLDLSPAMADGARDHRSFGVVADCRAVPLRDGAVDRALCLHMLYHVPDPQPAVAELRRIVRPGGRVVVTTNGDGHTIELKRILAEAARQVTGFEASTSWGHHEFLPQQAFDLLSAEFDEVVLHDLTAAVPVLAPEVFTTAVASYPPESVGLTAGPEWSAILTVVGELVSQHFAEYGRLDLTSSAWGLVAR